MVEINNQHQAFLDMRVVGGTDVTSENQINGYVVIVGGALQLLRSPRKQSPQTQNSNQQALGRTAFPVGGMPTASSLA